MEEIDDDPKNDLICTISESPFYVYKVSTKSGWSFSSVFVQLVGGAVTLDENR